MFKNASQQSRIFELIQDHNPKNWRSFLLAQLSLSDVSCFYIPPVQIYMENSKSETGAEYITSFEYLRNHVSAIRLIEELCTGRGLDYFWGPEIQSALVARYDAINSGRQPYSLPGSYAEPRQRVTDSQFAKIVRSMESRLQWSLGYGGTDLKASRREVLQQCKSLSNDTYVQCMKEEVENLPLLKQAVEAVNGELSTDDVIAIVHATMRPPKSRRF